MLKDLQQYMAFTKLKLMSYFRICSEKTFCDTFLEGTKSEGKKKKTNYMSTKG